MLNISTYVIVNDNIGLELELESIILNFWLRNTSTGT